MMGIVVLENTLHQLNPRPPNPKTETRLRSDLETKKANAACAMDRLEFLVSTRSGTRFGV